MATYTTYTESKSWFVVAMPTPGCRGDLYAALACTEVEFEKVHGRKAEYDTAFEVLSADDQILIRFELKEGST